MRITKNDSVKPITVRIPAEEYEYLREYADAHRVSLNWLVAEAIADYRAKIERSQAIMEIQAFQEELRDGRNKGSDSVDLLCNLRETRVGPAACSETERRLGPGQDEGAGS